MQASDQKLWHSPEARHGGGRAAAARLSPEHAEHRVPRHVDLIPAFDHLQAASGYTRFNFLGADHAGTGMFRYT